jgi:WD40 repeat protein
VSTDVGAPRATGNPYVGPQSFRRGDAIYGRDRETADLLDLLIAERVVLLYSPSGAGKSSLIAAGLMRQLETEGFEVLPVVRLTHDAPPGSTLSGPPRNRYVLSTLLSLEEGLPPEHQHPINELDAMTVTEYLSNWPDLDHRPDNEVVLFDQFEEVITADPTDHAAKEEFFADIGIALRDRNLWALFSIREDFLAELDPYAHFVPTRFANRYRLDLLGVDQALEAMILPAADRGADFKRPAAEKLVDDLRRIRVQRPSGVAEELGPTVEPVQLQVACRQVWNRLDENASAIDVGDVEALGNVDQALASYYAECVAAAAAETGVSERALRDWFETELVTPQGIRGQVLYGPQDGTFSERAVRMLTDAHLVRAESRRGATWYEMAHDRLIEPVKEDNARWREQHMSYYERMASWWDEQDRPGHLLLAEHELPGAERWAADHPDAVSPLESDFIEESHRARDQAERDRRARRRTRRWLVIAVIGCVVAVAAAAVAWRATDSAEDLARAAEISGLAAQASGAVAWDVDLGLLLGAEAASASGPDLEADTHNALQMAADQTPVIRVLRGHGPAWTVAYSDDGTLIATGHDDGTVALWDAATGAELRSLPGAGTVWGIDVSPDGSRVAIGGTDGQVTVWNTDGSDDPVPLQAHGGNVWNVAFSPDGSRVASAGADGSVVVGDATNGAVSPQPQRLDAGNADVAVNDVAWVDDQRLVMVDDDGVASWWTAGSADPMRQIDLHADWAVATDLSDDASLLASVGRDGVVVVSDLETGTEVDRLEGFGYSFNDASFSADGSRLVTVDDGGNAFVTDPVGRVELRTVTANGMSLVSVDVDPTHPGRAVVASREGNPAIWDLAVGHPDYTKVDAAPDGSVITWSRSVGVNLWSADRQVSILVPSGSDQVTAAAVSPDGAFIAVARNSGAVALWPTSGGTPVDMAGHNGGAWTVGFSPDGRYLASGGADALVKVWDVQTGLEVHSLSFHTLDVVSVDFGSDSRQLASASSDGTTSVWDLDDPTAPPRVLPPDAEDVNAVEVDWSPRGDLVAVRGYDTVTVWDPEQRDATAAVRRLDGHTVRVNDIAFDRTGDVLVSGGDDRSVIVWDPTNGEIIDRTRHQAAILSTAFAADGRRVWLTDYRGAPYVMWLDDDELLRVAEQRTTRDLRPAECRLYVAPIRDCQE